MDADELSQQLEELETKLERLRSLYEQYFLGIEKIEPMVARKDVDRRIWLLRREQIRNTARRFKLQTIIQRYNTFQQYWQRICREIENGTYKRHLARQKPASELLTIAARKRLGKRAAIGEAGPESAPRSGPASARAAGAETPPSAAISEPAPTLVAIPETAALSQDEVPKRPAKPLPPRKEAAVPAREHPAKPALITHLDESAAAGTERLPPQKPGRQAPEAPPAAAAASPAAAVAPPPKRAASPAKPHTSGANAAPPDTSSNATHLTPDRLRSLHERLVAAKGETHAPSLSSLEKSLRATEAKLQKEHQNRRIDFDVVIKDGRPIIKPIVR